MTAVVLIVAAVALLLLAVFFSPRRRPPVRGRAGTGLVRPGAAPKRQLRRNVPHALYCYPHLMGGVIYVGISNEPEARHLRRLRQFEAGDPRVAWVADSTRQMQVIQWFPDWATAREAEKATIAGLAREGHPIVNVQDNPLRKGIRRAA